MLYYKFLKLFNVTELFKKKTKKTKTNDVFQPQHYRIERRPRS